MTFKNALKIVLDLAHQNALEPEDLRDDALVAEADRQNCALAVVAENACDGEAEWILLCLSDQFPGLADGATEVGGSDLVEAMPPTSYFKRLRRKNSKPKKAKA